MKQTPEGRVKNKTKEILKAYEPQVYGHWIVQNGMGSPTLDYIGCCCGKYFTIETKADDKKLTPRQNITKESTEAAAGTVFVVVGEQELGLLELDAWLHATVMQHLSAKIKFNRWKEKDHVR